MNTNANTSYAAGRLAQLQDFPLWVYRHSDSVLHPRPHHVALDGLTLPSKHHFWQTYYPPNGWGCHCYVVGAVDMDMARVLGGGKTDLPINWDAPDGEGRLPGIDRGWNYMPGGSVSDAVRAHAAKLAVFPAEIGAAFGKDIRPWMAAAWPDRNQPITKSVSRLTMAHGGSMQRLFIWILLTFNSSKSLAIYF